jgi:hypothetical protein
VGTGRLVVPAKSLAWIEAEFRVIQFNDCSAMKRRSFAATSVLSVVVLMGTETSPGLAIQLAHYTFGQVNIDGPNYTTPDFSGRGNALTLKGGMTDVNLVAGKIGGALNFEGGTSTTTRDRVEAAENVADFDRDYTQFTFATWIKPIGIPSNDADVAFIAGKLGNSPNRGWQLGWTGTDASNPTPHPHEILVSVFDQASGGLDDEMYSGATSAMANDTWAHVAFTFSGINEPQNFLRIYVNGSKVNEITSLTANQLTLTKMTGSNAVPFQIGNRGDQRADSWRGLIDDVYVFDNALTDSEIAALMAPGIVGGTSAFTDGGTVPEPASTLLMLTGLNAALLGVRFRRG